MQTELEYLYRLERFGIKPGLAVMEQLMDLLDNPEKKFKSIHVTGTNGKGSTCAMLESVLRTSGVKTALYTSPHLYTFNERIKISGVSISGEHLIALIQEIRNHVEQNNLQPTFFEFTTALAFLHFSRSEIDLAVIEVGMGGRLDATNVITPIISVITNVGLDHTEYLGDTVELIAEEKAGIIKEGVPVITREEDGTILKIFDGEAKKKNTRVIRAQDVVKTKVLHADLTGQEVEVTYLNPSTSLRVNPLQLQLPLLGAHQVKNLATVLAVLATLFSPHPSTSLPTSPSGLRGAGRVNPLAIITYKNIITGVKNVTWEGRLQVVSQKPLIIVDGAHNPDGAQVLANFLKTIPKVDVVVFAAKKGKNIKEVLEIILPRCKHVIVTKGSYMPEEPKKIATIIRDIGYDVEVREIISDAITLGLQYSGNDGVMVVAGSLYMIPDALSFLTRK